MCHRQKVNYSGNTYLGIHMGIHQMKACIVDADLQVIYSGIVRYDVDVPEFKTRYGARPGVEPNEFQINPVMYIKSLDILINCLESQGADLHSVVAIGSAAHHHGCVYWSEKGFRRLCGLNPRLRLHQQLCEESFAMPSTPVWVDNSAVLQCFKMSEEVGGGVEMVNITGCKCYPIMTGPHIRTIFERQPDVYRRTVRISLMSSFLASLFIGNIASIDLSDGSCMNLLDIYTKNWSKELLEACAPRLRKRLMKPIEASRLQGRIADYYIRRWNFRSDCMVVCATGSCPSMVAAFKLDDKTMIISLSPNDKIIMSFSQRPQLGEGLVMCHPTNVDKFIGLLTFRSGAELREAVCNELANGDWAVFNEMLKSTPMGNEGRIAVRFDENRYAPGDKGTFRWDRSTDEFSIDSNQGLPQFEPNKWEARAIIEGQLMQHRVNATCTGFNFQPDSKIIVVGFQLKNLYILQILADIFNAPVYMQEGEDPYVLGAAYRARYAFYEHREVNCDCERCRIKTARQPKLSYDNFFKPVFSKIQLAAKPSPGCVAAYDPLLQRYLAMCRVLDARPKLIPQR